MKTKFLKLMALTLGLFLTSSVHGQTFTYNIGDKVTTDDGIYIVKGTNLITNPSFDDGTTGWYDGTNAPLSDSYFDVPQEGGADGGAYLKSLSSAGSGSAQSIKTGWQISPNKTYLFSCWAKRPSIDGNAQYSRVFLSTSATATTTQVYTINYAPAGGWVHNEYVFDSGEYTYLVANLGWLNSPTCLDCFSLVELEPSGEIATQKLEDEIAAANALLASTEEGTEKGQYTAEVRQALKDAIAKAEGVLASATSQTEINDAVAALKDAENVYKNNANPPFKVGAKYSIVHSSGYYLTTGGDGGTVKIVDGDFSDNSQIFTFTPAPDGAVAAGYNLADQEHVYVYRSGSWDTKASSTQDLTVANAIFQVVDMGDYVQLKNMGSGSVLGTDANTSGSAVYSNKNGTDGKYRWTLVEFSVDGIIEPVIKKAKDVIAAAEVGPDFGQVPQSAVDELLAAIAKAEADKETATMETAGGIASTLQKAIDKFNASFNALTEFDTDLTYYIQHYGGCVLTATASGNATITTLGEEEKPSDPQKMILESAGEPLTYYIKSMSDGTYLSVSVTGNAYDTEWVADKTNNSKFRLDVLGGKYIGLYCVGKGMYFGTDGIANGEKVYSDKGAATYSYWTIQTFQDLDRTSFNAAYKACDEFYQSMEAGYKIGMYLPEIVEEYAQLMAQYKSRSLKAETQEELEAIVLEFLTTIDTYKAMVNTQDYNDYRALNTAITTAQRTLGTAVAGDANGQYPKEYIDAYQKALDDALPLLNNDDATQEQIDAAVEALNAAAAELAAQKVVINFATLNSTISDAQKTLSDNEKYKGDGPGTYPTASFDALQKAINEAKTYQNSTTANQAAVDAAAAALAEAVKTFLDSWIDIDRSELVALLEALKALDLTGLADDDLEIYAYDIEVGEKAMTSNEQADIDRAVKILSRDYKYLTQVITAISDIAAGNAVEGAQYFTVGGVSIPAPQKGICIVRLANGRTYKVLVK